jgi:hypothetical protein
LAKPFGVKTMNVEEHTPNTLSTFLRTQRTPAPIMGIIFL